jgi:hypothetical protein
MDFEHEYTQNTCDMAGVATSHFLWENAGGTNKNYVVFQQGRYLHFFKVTADNGLSSVKSSTVIDLDTYKSDTLTALKENNCQYAFGQGYLFVVHPFMSPIYVELDSPSTDTFTATVISIQIRDTEGVLDETGYAYETRPGTLTDLHVYNLRNQGWTDDIITRWQQDHHDLIWVPNTNGSDPLGWQWEPVDGNARSDFPSNADVWWTMKNSKDDFNVGLADNNSRGGTPAPKGHYIYDAFDMDRATVAVIAGIPSTTSGVYRPSCVAFFAGRAFYAGVNTSGYSNKIFFSQLIKTEEQFGKCYQLNDPTNEYLFDLLATDGGVLTVPEIGQVIFMLSLQNILFIFATNGVWALSGNVGLGFTAGDYSIRKVSSVPSVSASSFVDVGGAPYWWNNDGIYYVSEVSASGGIKIDSLTQNTIRTYYKTEIPLESKKYARGAYNYLTKEIRWLFSSETPADVTSRSDYDRALTFNVQASSFYPWSFDITDVKLKGIISIVGQGTTNQIIDEELTPVHESLGSVFKYFLSSVVATVEKLTVGETKDTTFVDFKTYDGVGVNYTSYLVTGYKLSSSSSGLTSTKGGGADKKFQSNYITVFFRNYDTPKIWIQTSWNYANNISSHRFSSPQILWFENTTGLEYLIKKVKVRGSGKALQIRFTSVDGEPFDLAGWARFETINAGI